jgi:serine phosphatase RsbU (regulator of sigma subunit)
MLAAMDRCLRRELTGMKGRTPYFTTILVATHSPGRLVYSAAGVEPAIVFHGIREYERLSATGSAIGIEEDPHHMEIEMPFVLGDMLVAYTDGVTESRSLHGGKMLGDEGVVDIVRRVSSRNSISMCGDVFSEIESWTGGLFYDDVSLAVMFPLA